jgi:hypothetical protein
MAGTPGSDQAERDARIAWKTHRPSPEGSACFQVRAWGRSSRTVWVSESNSDDLE